MSARINPGFGPDVVGERPCTLSSVAVDCICSCPQLSPGLDWPCLIQQRTFKDR
jgi:hypothetical protein